MTQIASWRPARWSLRWKLVLPLLVLGLLLIGGGSWILLIPIGHSLEQAHLNQARAIVTAVSLAAESTHRVDDLQRYVTVLGGQKDVNFVMVVGGQPARVLACTKNRFVNKLLEEMPREMAQPGLIRDTMAQRLPRQTWRQDDQELSIIAPLVITNPLGQEGVTQQAAVLVNLDARSMWSGLRWIRHLLLGLSALVIVLAVGVAYVLVNHLVLRPAKQIRRVLDRLAVGDPKARVEVRTTDEIGQLAFTLNHTLNALAQEEQRFATLVQNIPGAVFRISIDGQIVFVSDTIERLTGQPASNFINQRSRYYLNLVHPEDLPRLRQAAQQAIQTRSGLDIEYRLRHEQQGYRWVRERARASLDAAGKPAFLEGIAVDITLRKQAEEELRQQQQRYQTFLETTIDGIHILDERGNLLEANRAFAEMLGYSSEELKGQNLAGWDAQEPRQELLAEFAKFLDYPGIFETRYRRRDGRLLDVEVSVTGAVLGGQRLVFCASRDISQRKQMEKRLRRTQYAIDHGGDMVYWVDREARILEVNEAVCRRLGCRAEDLVGKSVADVDPNFAPDYWAAFWQEFTTKKQMRLETLNRTLAGEIFPAEVTANYVQVDQEELNCSFIRDISERQKQQQQLLAALNQAREFELLFHTSNALVCVGDFDWHFQKVNRAWTQTLGFSEEELLACSVLDLIHPDDVPTTRAAVDLLLLPGSGPGGGENRLRCKDGSFRWLSWNIVSDWENKKVFCVAIDISEQKQAVRRLEESEENLRLALEAAEMGTYDWDMATNKTIWSREHEVLFGFAPGTFRGTYAEFEDCLHPEDRPGQQQAMQQALAQRAVYHHEYRIIWPDGSLHWIGSRGKFYCNADGQPVRMRGVLMDITQRKKIEEELRAANETLGAMIQALPLSIQVLDRDGKLVDGWNPASERIFGWRREEVLGKQLPYIPADRFAEFWDALQRVLHGQSFAGEERERVRKDGSSLTISIATAPIRDRSGVITHCLSVVADVTERKRAEQRLQLAAQVFENSLSGIVITDADNNYVSVNRAFTRLTGYTLEEVQGHNPRLMQSGRHDQAFYAAMWSSISSKGFWQGEIWNKRKNGELFCEWLTISAVRDQSGRIRNYIGIFEDRTEQLKAADALRESEEKYRLFLQNFQGIAYQALNLTWKPDFFYGTVQEITGYRPEDLLSGQVSWDQVIFPEDLPAVRAEAAYLNTRPGYLANHVHRIRRQDGQVRWVNEISQVIRTCPDGAKVVQGAIYDITERKQAEEKLRASLREKEALLKEIHHRVKNNLQIISSLLSLQEARSQDALVVEGLRQSRNRVRSMALAHESLYRSGDLSRIDLAQHMRSLCDHLRHSYGLPPAQIELQLEVEPLALDLDHVIPLGLIVNELVTNAFKYAFPGGRPGLVRVAVAGQGPGKYTLTVADNGVGLPPGLDLATAPSLGLQLVFALAQQLAGQVEVERSGGTTVRITFTAASEGGNR